MTTAVSTQVRGYVSEGTLAMPANYSAENALKAAMLMLPEIKDANKGACVEGLHAGEHQGRTPKHVRAGLKPRQEAVLFYSLWREADAFTVVPWRHCGCEERRP